MAAENFKVKKGLEVGIGATITSEGVNVTGIITATQFKGDGSGLELLVLDLVLLLKMKDLL